MATMSCVENISQINKKHLQANKNTLDLHDIPDIPVPDSTKLFHQLSHLDTLPLS
jgi:hypothetical protein